MLNVREGDILINEHLHSDTGATGAQGGVISESDRTHTQSPSLILCHTHTNLVTVVILQIHKRIAMDRPWFVRVDFALCYPHQN